MSRLLSAGEGLVSLHEVSPVWLRLYAATEGGREVGCFVGWGPLWSWELTRLEWVVGAVVVVVCVGCVVGVRRRGREVVMVDW